MSEMKLWIRAQHAIHEFGITLFPMGISHQGDKRSYVKEIVYADLDTTALPNDNIGFTLDNDAARRLMDDLWLAGVRPSKELHGSTDKEDIKNHLDDMRKIVFQGITINLANSGTETK
jgi:hypothetical protein